MDPETPPAARNSALTMVLAIGTLGAFFIFLILLTNGWFLWLVLGVSALGALGLFHYMTWGRALMQATAAERAEAKRKAEQEPRW